MDNPELKRLLDDEGRLLRYQTKFKRRVIGTLYLAQRFEAGRTYTELEVNEIIRNAIAFEDYVLVRRDLVDYRCLSRTADGREYRRAETLPDVEQIL